MATALLGISPFGFHAWDAFAKTKHGGMSMILIFWFLTLRFCFVIAAFGIWDISIGLGCLKMIIAGRDGQSILSEAFWRLIK